MKPAEPRPAWLWPAASAVLVLAVLCACVLDEALWLRLGVFHLKPYFADWFAVLAASDAAAAGADPYAVPNQFDPLGRPHIYGPWWLELSHLGLSRESNFASGLALVFATLWAGVWMLRPRGPGAALAAAGLLIAPGFMLAYERANNDLVILLLLVAAGWAVGRTHRVGYLLAVSLVWLAAGLKIYPIAATGLLLARCARRDWRSDAGRLALALFGFAVIAVVYRADFVRAIGLVPRVDTAQGYGWPVIWFLWSHNSMLHLHFVPGLALGCIFWGRLAWGGRKLAPAPADAMQTAWWMAGVGSWTFCFWVNTNFSYRIILLLFPAAVWLARAQGPAGRNRLHARWAYGALMFTCWLSVLHQFMTRIETDFMLRFSAFALGLENGMVLGLTLYLGWETVRILADRLLGYRGSPGSSAASSSAASTS
jgi:hypothetical protein